MSYNPQAEHEKADKMLERVRALLAKAASSEFEAEAMEFTAKAHELMDRYAITQEQLRQAKQAGFRDKPIEIEIRLMDFHTMRRYFDVQAGLLWTLCRHNRCFGWASSGVSKFHIAGFESDVRFIEMLFTSLWEQMESRFRTDVVITPKYKSNARKGKVSFKVLNPDTAAEVEKGPNYRYEYMKGFIERIDTRLNAQEEKREQSVALVLANVEEQVTSYVQTLGLKLRPHREVSTVFDQQAREAGMKAGDRANLKPLNNLRQTPELPR